MSGKFVNRFRPQPLSESQPQLEHWFAGTVGQYLLKKERQLLQQLPQMHGYHLMELGVSSKGNLLEHFDNLHCFSLRSTAANCQSSAVVDYTALPLPSDTVETAVVHHALEFSPKPHAVLNEVARVVAPGGHVMLFILNPFSVLGLLKWPCALLAKGPVCRQHSLRLGRVVDWLRLLNFRPVAVKRGGFGPLPSDLQGSRWWQRLGCGAGLPGGAFYCIVARKQVVRPIESGNDLLKSLKVANLGWQQRDRPLPCPPHQILKGRKELDEC